MTDICNAEEERLLDDSMGVSPAGNRFLAIFASTKSTAELESGDFADEITTYTGDRPACAMGAAAQVTGAAESDNDADIEFADMPAATVGFVAICDSATATTAGVMRWWGALTADRTTEAGDTLRFLAGEIKARLA